MIAESQYRIEIDRFPWLKSDNRSGCIYKVISGKSVIGTYYLRKGVWLANPFISNLINQSKEQQFNSNQKAIAYIIWNHKDYE